MRKRRWILFLAGALVSSTGPLGAQQEHTWGVNLRVTGARNVGVTYALSPSVAIRPAVGIERTTSDRTFFAGGIARPEISTTRLDLDLDLLFSLASERGLTPYLGLGGSLGYLKLNDDTAASWTLRALFGIRVTLLERVALFGDLVLQRRHDGGAGALAALNTISLTTSSLGVLVYLN